MVQADPQRLIGCHEAIDVHTGEDRDVTTDSSPPAGAYGSGAVVTPEAVRLDFQAAGVGSRGVALLIDLVVLATLAIGLNLAVALIVSTDGLGLSDTAAIVVILILNFLIFFGYPIGMETLWRGRSLGKAALGL